MVTRPRPGLPPRAGARAGGGRYRERAVCVLLVGPKYGHGPDDPTRNLARPSATEFESDEAVRLGRPVLVFIQGVDHPGRNACLESDLEKARKLAAFRKRVKLASLGGKASLVYVRFDSLQAFKKRFVPPLAELRDTLDAADQRTPVPSVPTEAEMVVVRRPAAYFFGGSRSFVGWIDVRRAGKVHPRSAGEFVVEPGSTPSWPRWTGSAAERRGPRSHTGRPERVIGGWSGVILKMFVPVRIAAASAPFLRTALRAVGGTDDAQW